MPPRQPISDLPTHAVTNQPPPLAEVNLFESDPILAAGIEREGADWAKDHLKSLGARLGSEEVWELGEAANRHPPELKAFDRHGRRIDQVEFHPAYHQLMALGIEAGVHAIAWDSADGGGHLAHLALEYMLVQVEAGVCCPLTMSYAALPCLRQAPGLAADWEPKLLSRSYDPRALPAGTNATAAVAVHRATDGDGFAQARLNNPDGDAHQRLGA